MGRICSAAGCGPAFADAGLDFANGIQQSIQSARIVLHVVINAGSVVAHPLLGLRGQGVGRQAEIGVRLAAVALPTKARTTAKMATIIDGVGRYFPLLPLLKLRIGILSLQLDFGASLGRSYALRPRASTSPSGFRIRRCWW